MIHPIYVYGESVLREKALPVDESTSDLQQLIDDMLETMHAAAGIGLAAPQIGRPLRVFVVDLTPMMEEAIEEGERFPPQPMVFINPEIVWESEEDCEFEEGCLSIPDLRELVVRAEKVRLRYLDRDLELREVEAGGLLSRVIQHEYDHLQGILFIDRISPFRRRLLRRRLRDMSRGEVVADYLLSVRAG
jgi:peptide deformylase